MYAINPVMSRILVILATTLLLNACGLWGSGTKAPSRAIPPHPELERTRTLLDRAAKEPGMQQHFKTDLDRARVQLDQAQALWVAERGQLDEDDDEWRDIRHLNYMARQRTAIAIMKARGMDAQRGVSELMAKQRGMPVTGLPTTPAPAPDPVSIRDVTARLPESLRTLPALPEMLQRLEPRQESRGMVLTLNERYFVQGQANLNGGDAELDAVVKYLAAHPRWTVACEGHNDGQGAEALDQKLSQQRARVVQQALLERGLEFNRVTAVGYGNTYPQKDGSRNRRVEIVIADSAAVGATDATSQRR